MRLGVLDIGSNAVHLLLVDAHPGARPVPFASHKRPLSLVQYLDAEGNISDAGQRELTEHFATADVAEAFLNDPYHPDGTPKPSIVCSTEADSDAALTMQIFKNLAGTPVLFADVRHYHADLGLWDLCNSGEHATYFAGRSNDPAVNLAKTEFRPQGFYFPAGGAAVYHVAAPGPVTLARLTRRAGRYRMVAFRAEFADLGDRAHEVAAISQDNWPHAFAKFSCTPGARSRVRPSAPGV